MLRSANELEGYAVDATDGVIGHVKDVYFDDKAWVIRYLVVETGGWLSSRKVLVSPIAIGTPNWNQRLLPASVSQEQIRKSPDIDTDKPVSRQHEIEYSTYYDYPYYWGGAGLWGAGMGPGLMLPGSGGLDSVYPTAGSSEEQHERARRESARHEHDDPHLRSCNAVKGYHIHAKDGHIGHVADLLVDEQTWAVRYLVVDTSNWWLGHKVLIAPQWILDTNWADESVTVSMTRQAIQDAPVYDPQAPMSRDVEDRLYQHYGQAGYSSGDPIRKAEIPGAVVGKGSGPPSETNTPLTRKP